MARFASLWLSRRLLLPPAVVPHRTLTREEPDVVDVPGFEVRPFEIMLWNSLHVVVVVMGIGTAVVACGDAASSGGAGGGIGGSTTSTTVGGSTTATGMMPEPMCAALTGAPTWTMHSPALPNWSAQTNDVLTPHILGMSGLAYGNGTWVMIAASTGLPELTWATSTDAETWTEHKQSLAGPKITPVRGLVWDGKRFLFFAGHDDGKTYAYTTSDPTTTWQSNKVSDLGNSSAGIASTGDIGVFVTGAGKAFSTTDFATWTEHSPMGGGGFLDLAVGGGHFVGTTASGDFVSPDGVTWTKIATDVETNVDYGKGAFHARGANKQKSLDGTTWTDEPQSGDPFGMTDGSKPYFQGNRFVLTHIDFTTGKSNYSASSDGAAWSEFGSDTTGLATPAGQGVFPLFLVYGGCHYIAAGNTIQSDSTKAPYIVVATAPPGN